MNEPVILWRQPDNSFGYCGCAEGSVKYCAAPVEDFSRMESDARAYRRVLDVIADPRLRDAPIAKTLADLGLDQPAGPPVKVMYFTSSPKRDRI